MSIFLSKYLGTHKFQNLTSEFDVTTFKLTNAPPTNNSNAAILSRNSGTGNLEVVDKISITGNLTLINSSAAPSNVPVLTNPGSNVAFPCNFTFRSLIAGSGVTFNVTPQDITINSTGSGTSSITINSLGGTAIPTTTGLIALPGSVSFRGLVAGTGISLVPSGTTITITNTLPDTGSVNIYNSNGTLTADRTVNLSSRDLIFAGDLSNEVRYNDLSLFQVVTNGGSLINTATLTMGVGFSLTALVGGIGINGNTDIDGDVRMAFDGGYTEIGENVPSSRTTIFSPDIRLPGLPQVNTNYVVQYNPIVGNQSISYREAISYYGILNYNAQTTQVFNNVNPAVISGLVVGTIGANASSNIVLSGTNNGIVFSGSNQLFEIEFAGNIIVNAGVTQVITVTIFIDSTEIDSSARNQITASSTSGNMNITTRPIITTLGSGAQVRVGFARTGTDTSLTFSGSIKIRNIVLS